MEHSKIQSYVFFLYQEQGSFPMEFSAKLNEDVAS